MRAAYVTQVGAVQMYIALQPGCSAVTPEQYDAAFALVSLTHRLNGTLIARAHFRSAPVCLSVTGVVVGGAGRSPVFAAISGVRDVCAVAQELSHRDNKTEQPGAVGCSGRSRYGYI